METWDNGDEVTWVGVGVSFYKTVSRGSRQACGPGVTLSHLPEAKHTKSDIVMQVARVTLQVHRLFSQVNKLNLLSGEIRDEEKC
jgi:hypothetical protein